MKMLLLIIIVFFDYSLLFAEVGLPFSYDRAAYAAQQGHWEKARNELKKNLVDKSDNADLLYDAGVASYELKDFSQACAYFTQAAICADDNALKEKACFNAGNSCVALNELESALDFYEKSLAVNFSNEFAIHNRDLVKQMLAQQKQQENQQQKKDQDKNKDKDSEQKNQQDEQEQDKDQQNKDEQNNSQDNQSQDSQSKDDQSSTNDHSKSQQGNDNQEGKNNNDGDDGDLDQRDESGGEENETGKSADEDRKKERNQKEERSQRKKNNERGQDDQFQNKSDKTEGKQQKNQKANHRDTPESKEQSSAASLTPQQDLKQDKNVGGEEDTNPAEQEEYEKLVGFDNKLNDPWLENILKEQEKKDNAVNKQMLEARILQHGGADAYNSW